MTLSRRALGAFALLGAFLLYVAAVVAPNILIAHFGIVDVAPGPWVLMAPAAVYAVGVALVARDILHELAGVRLVIAAILLGTLLSALLTDSIKIAAASGAAFLFSELLDLTIYQAIRHRSWALAALVSSYIGAVLDSIVFLGIAFGSMQFLPGQWAGKAISITVVVVLAVIVRWIAASRRPEPRLAA